MATVNATVNGITFASKHVKAYMPSGYIIELKSIDYGDNMNKETINNMNGIPIGEYEEEYKADCKMTVGVTEFNKLVAESAAFGGLYGLPAFKITVVYLNNDGLTFIDTITASIKKSSRKVGDKEKWIGNDLEMNVVGPILWNGIPAYTPQ